MGGKTKQSQRTKNNVRPSSSGRSAELLSTTIKLDSSLVSGKELPVLFPTLNAATIDQGLSPEYSVCFKQLNKKDPYTKTKALQKITELVKNGNVEDAVAALSSWANHYQVLVTDSDRRVREAAQACHGALVSACGRRAAPALRRLLPGWLLAHHDDHAPAAELAQAQLQAYHGALVSACGRRVAPALRRPLPGWLLAHHDDHAPAAELAQAQLQSTFPDSKLGEALSFCKSEIMTLLIDNLSGNTEAMLSKKVDNVDERRLQIERILSSSLRALELFITKLPQTHDEWLWEKLRLLLQSVEFWKLFVHKSEHIRAAWYSACGRLCEREGERLGALGERVRIGKALVSTAERGAVAAQRWAAVLLLMHRVQDWYTWFERKDLLVKRLLDVLNNGGWGEAQPLSNMLLPLLSKLPAELVTKDFYTTFFDAIFTGLNNRNLLSSKSESQTWIKILEECLRYLSIQNHEYVLEVVTYVHRTWLENVFAINNTQARNHLIKYSATNMASLVKYWLKQTKEENSEKYDQLIRNFWLNIGSTISKQIDQLSIVENDNVTQLIESHILLLRTLKTMFASEGIRQRRIHFADEKTDEDVTPPSSLEQFDVTLTDRFEHNLTDVIENTCCSYFDFVNNKEVSQAIFTALYTFIEEFENKKLLIALARHFKQETLYGFYETVLKQWLTGDTGCEPLVDIVFIVMKHLTEEEQDRTFETFQQFPPLVSEWCLSRAVSCPQGASGAARRWLHAPAAERSVAALGGRAAAGDVCATRLLLACLAHDIHGEPLVSSAAVSRAVEQLGAVGGAGACALRVLHELARAPHAPRRLLAAPLLEALFQHSLDHPRSATPSAPRACRDALVALPPAAREPLVSRARGRLHANVFRDFENLDIDRIAHAASLYPYLFVASEDTTNTKTPTEIVSHIKRLFDMETEKPKVPLEVYALRCDCIDGNINCPFENDNEFIAKVVSESDDDYEELTRKDLMLFLYNSLFRMFVMRDTLCEDAEDVEDAEETGSRSEELIKEELVKEELNRVFYDTAVLGVLVERYAFWSDYDLITQGMQQMESLIESILSVITPETKDVLLSHFSKNAAARGYYWSYARKLFDEKINVRIPARPNDTLESEVSVEDRSSASRNIENNEADDESTSKTPESELSECLNVTDAVDAESSEDIVTGNGYFHSLQAERGAARGTRRALMVRSVLAAHARDAALGEQLARDARTGRAPADVIIDAYYRHNHLMLYKTDLSAAPWSMIVSNAAIVQFLEEEVRERGWDLPAHQWDFTTIALCSLVESLQLSEHRWGCCKVAVLARAVLELLGAVHAFAASARAEAERRRPSAHVAALPAEWRDVFAPDLARNLLRLVARALDDEGPMSASRVATLAALAARLACLPAAAPGAPPPHSLAARAASALRRVSPAARKYLAFAALDFVSEPLVLEDAEKLAAWCAREDESPRPEFSLGYLDDALVHLQDLLDAALSNVKVCEGTCEMLAGSDSHSVALGLLLLAAHLLRHSARARADLAQFYIELLREGAYAGALMASCVRLLPVDVLAAALEPDRAPPARRRPAFEALPPRDMYRRCDADTVGALACFVLTETLGGAMAGEARGWAGALGARAGATLRRLVSACVAPVLRRRLLGQLGARAHELPDAHVAIQWSRAEVRCALELEERTLELTLQLADEHPLVPPTVTAPPNSPAPDTNWIVLYLAYQNGTLLNALKMWISAVSARVQSAPQCYICYCRMHPSSGRLPAVPCHQCRNKFHSPCLRKWFSTSNKSNCPLCRTKF